MAILDLKFNRKTTLAIEDMGTLVSSVLGLKVPFTIVQYMLAEHGVVMRISVPDEKLKEIMKVLRENKIQIRNAAISVNNELCIDCGACISLCNTQALYFDKDFKRSFDQKKCVGCKLCIDACPRHAIYFEEEATQ
jgi:NAD-dependent dihydropyrimidine dehydrogenase PreA subunit